MEIVILSSCPGWVSRWGGDNGSGGKTMRIRFQWLWKKCQQYRARSRWSDAGEQGPVTDRLWTMELVSTITSTTNTTPYWSCCPSASREAWKAASTACVTAPEGAVEQGAQEELATVLALHQAMEQKWAVAPVTQKQKAQAEAAGPSTGSFWPHMAPRKCRNVRGQPGSWPSVPHKWTQLRCRDLRPWTSGPVTSCGK